MPRVGAVACAVFPRTGRAASDTLARLRERRVFEDRGEASSCRAGSGGDKALLK